MGDTVHALHWMHRLTYAHQRNMDAEAMPGAGLEAVNELLSPTYALSFPFFQIEFEQSASANPTGALLRDANFFLANVGF